MAEAARSDSTSLYSNSYPSSYPYTLTAGFVQEYRDNTTNRSYLTVYGSLTANNQYWSSAATTSIEVYWRDNYAGDVYCGNYIIRTSNGTNFTGYNQTRTGYFNIWVTHKPDGTLQGSPYVRWDKGSCTVGTCPNGGDVATVWTDLWATVGAGTSVCSINPIGDSRTTINLQRNWDRASWCQYNINDMGWIAENTSYANGISVSGNTVGGLTPNTQYKCQIFMGNDAGSLYSNTAYATTLGNAPSVTTSVSSINHMAATIGTSASYDTNSTYYSMQIEYGTTQSYGIYVTNPASSTTLSPLSAGTKYYYKVSVTDNWGRTGVSAGSFTTLPALPTVTALAYMETTSNSITVKVQTYHVYGDAKLTGFAFSSDDGKTFSTRQSSDTYKFTGLKPSTTYKIRVNITDSYGRTNMSDPFPRTTLSDKAIKVITSDSTKNCKLYVITSSSVKSIPVEKIKIIK